MRIVIMVMVRRNWLSVREMAVMATACWVESMAVFGAEVCFGVRRTNNNTNAALQLAHWHLSIRKWSAWHIYKKLFTFFKSSKILWTWQDQLDLRGYNQRWLETYWPANGWLADRKKGAKQGEAALHWFWPDFFLSINRLLVATYEWMNFIDQDEYFAQKLTKWKLIDATFRLTHSHGRAP